MPPFWGQSKRGRQTLQNCRRTTRATKLPPHSKWRSHVTSLPLETGSWGSCKYGGIEGEAGHAPARGLQPHRLQAEPASPGTVGLQHVRRGHRGLALWLLENDEVEPGAQAPADRGFGGPDRPHAALPGRDGQEDPADSSGEPGGGGCHHERCA